MASGARRKESIKMASASVGTDLVELLVAYRKEGFDELSQNGVRYERSVPFALSLSKCRWRVAKRLRQAQPERARR
jgi:hypothetical protein